jgi:predicted glycosyltransferase
MRILIDIGHPAHVHLFKNFAWIMQKNGHRVFFTSRDKEVTIQLLRAYQFDFIAFGKPFKRIIGKIWGLIKFDFLLFKIALKFRPDIFLSAGSIYAAQVSWLLNKPHITFEDTGNMEQIRLYKPFSKIILVSTAFHKELGEKQIRYKGYHELAYLHPDYFQPDDTIFDILKLKKEEPFVIVRFVSWSASHDVGQSGFTTKMKTEIVHKLSQYAEVFVSAECDLPISLKKFQIKIPPERIHDVLAFAALFVGEGATMASECAMLGTPAIYVNSITAGTLEEQEKYGLLYSFRNSTGVLEKTRELINNPGLRQIHQERRKKMLADKINVTKFMCWFIENYPESVSIMKADPDYQLRIK